MLCRERLGEIMDNPHPPSPPFPKPIKRPYQVSGSHASACTAEVVVVFMTNWTRQRGAEVTGADDWQDPGVVTFVGAAT